MPLDLQGDRCPQVSCGLRSVYDSRRLAFGGQCVGEKSVHGDQGL